MQVFCRPVLVVLGTECPVQPERTSHFEREHGGQCRACFVLLRVSIVSNTRTFVHTRSGRQARSAGLRKTAKSDGPFQCGSTVFLGLCQHLLQQTAQRIDSSSGAEQSVQPEQVSSERSVGQLQTIRRSLSMCSFVSNESK